METAPTGIVSAKTHRRLRKAYCRIIKEKGADKVTVSALTEEADVSRATFYLHFQNIDEFKDDTEKYILTQFINQIWTFLNAGKTGAKQACKKKNLFFTDDDFDLFYCLFSSNRGFGFGEELFKRFFDVFSGNIRLYFDEKFIKKNKDRFDLFCIGYSAVMRENFLDYQSDKVYRDILRTIEIWDILFPDNKFKN